MNRNFYQNIPWNHWIQMRIQKRFYLNVQLFTSKSHTGNRWESKLNKGFSPRQNMFALRHFKFQLRTKKMANATSKLDTFKKLFQVQSHSLSRNVVNCLDINSICMHLLNFLRSINHISSWEYCKNRCLQLSGIIFAIQISHVLLVF